jgi:hypothetical protein
MASRSFLLDVMNTQDDAKKNRLDAYLQALGG